MATTIPSIACLGVIGRNNNPLHMTIFPSYQPSLSTPHHQPLRTPLQYSLLLSSTLDVFESRARHASQSGTLLSGEFGLLHAVDERLAAYGFETNTGIKFVAVVDMRGRCTSPSLLGGGGNEVEGGGGGKTSSSSGGGGGAMMMGGGVGVVGLREGELKVVFKAMQTAYVKLLQNPFYEPDSSGGGGGGSADDGGGNNNKVGGGGGAKKAGGGGGGGGGKDDGMGRSSSSNNNNRITSRRFANEMRRIGEAWTPGMTSL